MHINAMDAGEIKREVEYRFGVHLHVHDTCSGFYFSLDERNDDAADYVDRYLTSRGETVVMSEDGLTMSIGE